MSDYKEQFKQKRLVFELMKELRREIDYAIGRVGNMNEMPEVSESDYLAILTALQVSRRVHRDYRTQLEKGVDGHVAAGGSR